MHDNTDSIPLRLDVYDYQWVVKKTFIDQYLAYQLERSNKYPKAFALSSKISSLNYIHNDETYSLINAEVQVKPELGFYKSITSPIPSVKYTLFSSNNVVYELIADTQIKKHEENGKIFIGGTDSSLTSNHPFTLGLKLVLSSNKDSLKVTDISHSFNRDPETGNLSSLNIYCNCSSRNTIEIKPSNHHLPLKINKAFQKNNTEAMLLISANFFTNWLYDHMLKLFNIDPKDSRRHLKREYDDMIFSYDSQYDTPFNKKLMDMIEYKGESYYFTEFEIYPIYTFNNDDAFITIEAQTKSCQTAHKGKRYFMFFNLNRQVSKNGVISITIDNNRSEKQLVNILFPLICEYFNQSSIEETTASEQGITLMHHGFGIELPDSEHYFFKDCTIIEEGENKGISVILTQKS